MISSYDLTGNTIVILLSQVWNFDRQFYQNLSNFLKKIDYRFSLCIISSILSMPYLIIQKDDENYKSSQVYNGFFTEFFQNENLKIEGSRPPKS